MKFTYANRAQALRGKHADRSGVPDSVEADEDLVQASSAAAPSSDTGKPPEAAFTVKPPEAEQSEASHTTHSSQSDDVNASVSDEQVRSLQFVRICSYFDLIFWFHKY